MPFERIQAVRRVTTCAAIGSLLLAVVYGPLFHLHPDDHKGGGSLIHAHFPEMPHLETEPGPEVESHHDDGQVRPVDFLTTSAPALTHVAFFAVEEPLLLHAPQSRAGFLVLEEPRAHAPPLRSASIPRSPPV